MLAVVVYYKLLFKMFSVFVKC